MQRKSFSEVSIPEDAKYQIEENWEDQVFEEEKRKLLRDQMARLDNCCRKILALFFTGAAMSEIKEKLGLSSLSYAAKRKFKCKEKLVQLVKQDQRYRELLTQ